MPTYSIHKEHPSSVKPDLLRIWRDNLPVHGGVEHKYAWLYEDARPRNDIVFMLRADGQAVGTAGAPVRRFRIAGREAVVGLLADLAVDRPHRAVLPALRLVREVRSYVAASYPLSYGYPNRQAEGVFKRAGYRELGRFTRYARVLRHAPYADRLAERAWIPPVVARTVASHPVMARIAGAVADVGRLASDAPHAARALLDHALEWLEGPDERIDELWGAAYPEYPIIAERNAAFLRWRYPQVDAAELALTTRRGGAPCAYALLQRDGATAHIRDLFGHLDELGPLLDLLIPALYRRGVGSVSMRYAGNDRVVRILEEHGFESRESSRMIAYCIGEGHRDAVATIDDPASWHLTDLDEDV